MELPLEDQHPRAQGVLAEGPAGAQPAERVPPAHHGLVVVREPGPCARPCASGGGRRAQSPPAKQPEQDLLQQAGRQRPEGARGAGPPGHAGHEEELARH